MRILKNKAFHRWAKEVGLSDYTNRQAGALRQWNSADLKPFFRLNADPKVMEYFPGLKTKEESDHSVSLMSGHIEKCGWGFWVASLAETAKFIGINDFAISRFADGGFYDSICDFCDPRIWNTSFQYERALMSPNFFAILSKRISCNQPMRYD